MNGCTGEQLKNWGHFVKGQCWNVLPQEHRSTLLTDQCRKTQQYCQCTLCQKGTVSKISNNEIWNQNWKQETELEWELVMLKRLYKSVHGYRSVHVDDKYDEWTKRKRIKMERLQMWSYRWTTEVRIYYCEFEMWNENEMQIYV